MQIGAVALDGHIEVLQRPLVVALLHQQHSLLVVALGVVTIGAYGLVETAVSPQRVAQVEQCHTAIDVSLGILVGEAQNHIKIYQRLYELLVAQVCNAARVVRVWQVGPQVDGCRQVADSIFVVAQLRAHNASVVERLGVDGVDVDSSGEVLLGTEQVAQPQLGIAAQVVGLV